MRNPNDSGKKKRVQIESAIREACLVVGFFLLVIGIYLIYHPASFIIGGILIMWLGLPPKIRDKGGGG